MIDHVTLRVSDFRASKAFYSTVLAPLGYAEPWSDDEQRAADWGDLSISQDDKPLTENLHLAFVARDRAHVDEFHRVATSSGYRDNGPPGERPIYHEGYYGAFVLDPDDHNVEAVFHGLEAEPGTLDHIFLRVRDLEASRRFYETVSQPLRFGRWAVGSENDWVAFGRRTESMWLTTGEPSKNVHIAFAAGDRAEVDDFHRVAIEAGYRDNGPPGERPIYHEGYYGAFVLDPDGNNVEAVFHDR
jgi:catechol 2,3-dioxygenase-like lactoylglutathione lyase family enzyme